ncbi:hypothetical protein GPJ56_002773 [Histomonas meleagridis]|uniref:uncharacterized protein n=1 Tax=Histomonas meleagridis TaxID=135588 RepID=UPI00355A7895|nr:hypothetical protein GPJ56_002773 [Histomonas meleagridis]KAH0800080.1 hypothetical protein GO595_007192 [Histomonas meleagridis]
MNKENEATQQTQSAEVVDNNPENTTDVKKEQEVTENNTKNEEEKKSEPSKPQESSHSNSTMFIIIGAIAILIIGIVLYFILRKDRAIPFEKPIQYVFNSQFRNELETYVNLDHHKQILVLYGADGVGKTRGLTTFGEELLSDDRLVIDFDFRSISPIASEIDFVQFLQQSVISSFRNLDKRQSKLPDLRKSLSLVRALSTINGPISETVPNVCKDSLLQSSFASIYTVINSISVNPEISVPALFESINSISPLSPVIFIHDIERLNSFNNSIIRKFLPLFWNVCQNFARDRKTVSLIIEISDSSYLVDHEFLFESESYRIVRVGDLPLAAHKSTFVDNKILSPSEYQSISEKIGGHGQSYALLYEYMREGYSPNSAIKKLLKKAKNIIIDVIQFGETKNERKIRLNLIKKSLKQVISVETDKKEIKELLKWNVLALENRTHCSISNKIMEKAAEEVIKKIRK